MNDSTHVGSGAILEAADATINSEARVIANFAWQHLKAATTFRDHLLAVESSHAGQPLGAFFVDIRSYGSACIASTAGCLEGLINELFLDPNCGLQDRVPDFERVWADDLGRKKSALRKYQLALGYCGKDKMHDTEVYRETGAIFSLRNALIHFKPVWDVVGVQEPDYVTLLASKYTLSPFVDPHSDFVTMRTMSGRCMEWVIATAMRFIREFDTRARLNDQKMSQFWQFETP